MRLGYVDRLSAQPYTLQVWERNKQDPERMLYLIRTWAWSPWLQEAHHRLATYLHNRTTLDQRLKWLAIIRVCTRNYSSYELSKHVPAALTGGMTRQELEAIQSFSWEESQALTDEDRACLQYIDEFDSGRGVQAEVCDRLRGFLDESQLVTLSVQTGFWGSTARLMKALKVTIEPWRLEEYRHALNRLYPDNTRTVARIPRTAVERKLAGSRVGLVEWENASEKNRFWFSRWQERYGTVPNLVRVWAWNDAVQAAQQLLWEEITGNHIKLSPRVLSLVSRRVSWLNYSRYLLALLEPYHRISGLGEAEFGAIEGDFTSSVALSSKEKSVIRFVDAWDAGLGVGNDVFDAVFAHHDRQEMTEIQLAAGYFGSQARFAKSLEIEPD
jgi:alkylhydroperoxidase family enzyme